MNNNSSLYRWFLQRFTGFLLLICLAVHIIVVGLSSGRITFDIVIKRLQGNNFWVVFYVLFLGSALFHGLNGLYGVILDYAPSVTLKRILSWCFWIIGLVAFGWGVRVLIMFLGA